MRLPVGKFHTLYAIVRNLIRGGVSLQAMSLSYTTLLSLVPFLAVGFSVLKGFGVHQQLEPFLLHLLEPLGENRTEIVSRLLQFVENVQVGPLGAVGLIFWIYTAVSLLQKMESALNGIWHVQESRSLVRRYIQYLGILAFGPLLIFAAMAMTASLQSSAVVQRLVSLIPLGGAIGWFIPYLLVMAAFAFLYGFLPNTKVRFRSAVIGGAAAGLLWETANWGFAAFIVSSSSYAAVYAGFAILILFLIWLYGGWMIFLVGGGLSFYDQHPEYISLDRRKYDPGIHGKEALTLIVLAWIGRHFYQGAPPWTAEGLSRKSGFLPDAVDPLLATLERLGVLARNGDDPPRYLPAKPPEEVPVAWVINAIRHSGAPPKTVYSLLSHEPAIEDWMRRMEQGLSDPLRGIFWKDLALTREKETADDHSTTPSSLNP